MSCKWICARDVKAGMEINVFHPAFAERLFVLVKTVTRDGSGSIIIQVDLGADAPWLERFECLPRDIVEVQEHET